MEFKEQEFIIKIAECQSISHAAQKLHISQPALSKFLNQVEADLEIRLFERTNRHFKITPAGRLYIEKAREILRCRDEFHSELEKMKQSSQNVHFTIGIQTLRSARLSPKIYSAFYRHFPNGSIQFIDRTGRELIQMLEERRVDLILCSQINLPSNLDIQVLRKDTLLLAAAENMVLPCIPGDSNMGCQVRPPKTSLCGSASVDGLKEGFYDIVDLQQVMDYNFLLLPAGTSMFTLINQILWRSKLSLPHFQEINRQESSLHLASMGYGLAFTLDSYLPMFQLPKPVKCYRILQHMEPVNYVAASYPGQLPPELYKQMIGILREVLE